MLVTGSRSQMQCGNALLYSPAGDLWIDLEERFDPCGIAVLNGLGQLAWKTRGQRAIPESPPEWRKLGRLLSSPQFLHGRKPLIGLPQSGDNHCGGRAVRKVCANSSEPLRGTLMFTDST